MIKRNFMRKVLLKLIFIVLLSGISLVFCQSEQIRILAYNLLEYPNTKAGGDTTARNPDFRTIFASINPSPDIIAACEFNDNTSAAPIGFLDRVLNSSNPSLYNMGTFVPDGSHSDANVVYYKPAKFTFISSQLVIPETSSTNHPSYEYQLYNNLTGNKIVLFGVHFTSNGTSGSTERDNNAITIRSISDALPSGSYFISAGDYNFYLGGNEPAFSTLLEQTNSGYFLDPLNLPSGNSWSTSPYYPYYTISTRTTSFGGSSENYGLKYRIDLILNSKSIMNGGAVSFVPNSYTTYGNDGNHYQEDINKPKNTSVSSAVADALYYASDHIPVYADYTFSSPTNANPPYQGSIAFTQVGVSDGTIGHDDEIEFVTLYRMDLTKLKITNNPVQYDSTLETGGGTYDLSNTDWTDVPAGTHVRLGPNLTNENLSTGLSDGILTYGSGSSNLPSFSLSGDNVI